MSISVLEPDLSPTARINDRMQGVARAMEMWTRMKKREVPSDVWGYPPVISLVTKLDWEVLHLGHAVASRGEHAGEMGVSEIERRLVEVESTMNALDGILAGQSAPAGDYGYAI
jgi:hypothetical protein